MDWRPKLAQNKPVRGLKIFLRQNQTIGFRGQAAEHRNKAWLDADSPKGRGYTPNLR